MAQDESLNTALLSLYPRFAESILSGEKKIEFRKTNMNKEVRKVIIYSTAPVKRVVGYFEVEEIVSKKPSDLWEDFKDSAGLQYCEFSDYYHGKEKAIGIVVGRTVKFEKPLKLEELRKGLTPPQSFRYLSWSEIENKLKSRNFIDRIYKFINMWHRLLATEIF